MYLAISVEKILCRVFSNFRRVFSKTPVLLEILFRPKS